MISGDIQNNIFNRIIRRLFQETCNSNTTDDKINNAASNVDKNALERQTIDSKQISTISSIVDKTEYESKQKRKIYNQKRNYGLYALKFNRNEAKRSTCIDSQFAPERKWLNDKRCISAPIASHELKHEYFESCEVNRQKNNILNVENIEIIDSDEYYSKENRYDYDYKDIPKRPKRPNVVDNNKDFSIIRSKSNVVNERRKKMPAPVPPKRKERTIPANGRCFNENPVRRQATKVLPHPYK